MIFHKQLFLVFFKHVTYVKLDRLLSLRIKNLHFADWKKCDQATYFIPFLVS